VSMQDRCIVCAKHTVGSEIILDAPNVLLSDETQLEACFGRFRDSANLMQERCIVCVERTIGSEIIFDAPNGTPR
jgi:hypothetical protein